MAKAGRPKNVRPNDVKLQIPKHALKYKAKRLYWAMLEMEKKMSKDITSVKMSEYNALLSAYIDVVQLLNKEGIKYGTKTKQGMDKGADAQGVARSGSAEGIGEDGQADLGARVRAVNPIT